MAIMSVNGKAEFDGAVKSGVSIVDFYADWCGPCKMIAPVLEELATELEGKAQIVKVNVDYNQDLASDFKVQGVPTIFIVKDGQVVERAVGFQPKPGLLALVNKHL